VYLVVLGFIIVSIDFENFASCFDFNLEIGLMLRLLGENLIE